MAEYKVLVGFDYENPDGVEGDELRAEPGDVIDFEPAEWLVEQYIVEAVEAVATEEVAPVDAPEADAPEADAPAPVVVDNPFLQSAPVTSKVV